MIVRALASIAIVGLVAACGGDGVADTDPSDLASGDVMDAADGGAGDVADGAVDSATVDSAAEVDTPPPGPGIVIVEPSADAGIIRGLLPVILAPTGELSERIVEDLRLDVGDQTVFRGALLPQRLLLDTSRYPGASLALSAHAQVEGVARGDAVSLTMNNRPQRFISAVADADAYQNGQQIVLSVELNEPAAELTADFSALDSGWSPGDESFSQTGEHTYELRYRISAANNRPDGRYPITLGASYAGWQISLAGLALRLLNQPPLPLSVEGAIEVSEPMPAPTEWTAALPTLDGIGTIVTGGTLALEVDFRAIYPPSEVVGLMLGADGYHGFVQVPLQGSSGLEKLRLSLRQFGPADPAPPSQLTLEVALVDRRGRVSPWVSKPLSVRHVGAGDLQVSVAWDSPTDVDLHVTGPDGCLVYYGHKQCASGGELDLDSNPACAIDGVNNENVYWDTSQAPEGDYTVELRYWSDCGCCAARYAVAVTSCGQTEVYEGILYQGTSGAESAKRLITTVSSRDCGRTISGRVRYSDRLIDATGYHARTMQPARHVMVEVRRQLDGQLLASGQTDDRGRYRLHYTNSGDPVVFVRVLSRTSPGDAVRQVEVMDQPYNRAYYQLDSAPLDVAPSGAGHDQLAIDLDIDEAVGAGAFNILDQLVRGYDRVRRQTGRQLGALRAFWTTGEQTRATHYCSRALYDADGCIEPRSVTIQGFADDPDEWDDPVILRAMFGFALEQASDNDAVGGATDGRRVDPRQAWSEGVATFFANDVLDRVVWVDSRPAGVYLTEDLEHPWTPYASGVVAADGGDVASGEASEALSPWLVAALLYDLADGISADDPSDPVDGQRRGIYDVVFNRIGGFGYHDRGPVGADLVDFLDGFICRGYGAEPTLAPLLGARGFSYDFGGPASCD